MYKRFQLSVEASTPDKKDTYSILLRDNPPGPTEVLSLRETLHKALDDVIDRMERANSKKIPETLPYSVKTPACIVQDLVNPTVILKSR